MSQPTSDFPSDATGAPGHSAPDEEAAASNEPPATGEVPSVPPTPDDLSTVGTGTALALISIAIVLIVIVIGGVIAWLG